MSADSNLNSDSRNDIDRRRAWGVFRLLVLVLLFGIFYVFLYGSDLTDNPSWLVRETAQKQFAVGTLVRVYRTPETIATGEVLAAACRGCHGPELKGGIGPNLVDHKWLHKVDAERMLYRLIRNGIAAGKLKFGRKQNLMPPRGLLSSNADVWKVVFYLSSINRSIRKDAQ